jgi:hypothetical protein
METLLDEVFSIVTDVIPLRAVESVVDRSVGLHQLSLCVTVEGFIPTEQSISHNSDLNRSKEE